MKPERVYVIRHALDRLRERWPEATALSDRALRQQIEGNIAKAEKQQTALRTPGGTYIPFLLGDKHGFLVVQNSKVITILGSEYCGDVTDFLTERKQEKENGSI